MFSSDIFDPANTILTLQKRLNQKNIGSMLPNDIVCFMESMRSTAHRITLVACDQRSHSLFADDCFTDDDDTARSGATAPVEQVQEIARRIEARGHMTFGGALSPDAHGFFARSMAKPGS